MENTKETKEYVLVHEKWLEGLLEMAYKYELAYTESRANREFVPNSVENAIFHGCGLLGYSKSARDLLQYNERVSINKQKEIIPNKETDDAVTHQVFFGENIKRVWKTLFKNNTTN